MTKTYAVVDTETGQLVSISTEQPGANPSRLLTHLQFLRRFTDAELASIYAAENNSPIIEVWMDKFRLAQEINLDDQEIINGLYGMEQMGLLAEGRAVEVLK